MTRHPNSTAALTNRKERSASLGLATGPLALDAGSDAVAPGTNSGKGDEWLTPPALIAALGPFDLDPACPLEGTAPNMTWRTAERRFTAAENGLIQRWGGDVLLNPPYSKALIALFMARMALHNRGIAIVNARTDTVWFAKYVWPIAAALLFVYQRIKFIPATGKIGRDHARGAGVIIAYGADCADRLEASGIDGAFVPLPGSRQVVAVYRTAPDVTWHELMECVVSRQGGEIKVQLAYVLVRHHPKATANPNWQAKVRQILQGPAFERIAPATYRLKGEAA